MKLCGLLPPTHDVAAVSSSLHHRKYKVRLDVNMKLIPSIIFIGHSGCVHSERHSLNTTFFEGPIERRKLQLASREAGDGLTGAHNGGSLNRTESVLK